MVARASCGLMYWMGRDNGNELLGSPARRGPVQGGTLPHPSGAWEGVRAALCVGGRTLPHAHILAPVCPIGQRTDTRVGVQKKRQCEPGGYWRGQEQLLICAYLARTMQRDYPDWHGLCKGTILIGTDYARCTFFNQMSTFCQLLIHVIHG